MHKEGYYSSGEFAKKANVTLIWKMNFRMKDTRKELRRLKS